MAAEIGYAYAVGKRVVGYRGDFRLAADNIGSTVNLQVAYFIVASGGTIVTKSPDILCVLAFEALEASSLSETSSLCDAMVELTAVNFRLVERAR